MSRGSNSKAGRQNQLSVLGLTGALLLALPTASFAVVGFASSEVSGDVANSAFDFFTPATVDPALAARVADKARARGLRFTPATGSPVARSKPVNVAVRIDREAAQAISIRKALDILPGKATAIAALQPAKFNLGTARGYQSFAQPVERAIELPSNVSRLDVPDLAEFKPSKARDDKPSRLQPRISLEDNAIAGRSQNTLDANEASVDVGGSFRVLKNLDVTAGVRLSQERDRLAPLTDSSQDSQSVYVGTQVRF